MTESDLTLPEPLLASSEPAPATPIEGGGEGTVEGADGGRHRAREVALQVLYAIDLSAEAPLSEDDSGEGDADSSVGVARATAHSLSHGEAIFDRIAENFVVAGNAVDFARELVAAVVERADELDELVGAHAKNWRVARMAAVDRNVLRMAVYELRDTTTPLAVVIDEAVDLARRFGSDRSPSFVNGVLDAVAREVREE